MIRSIGIVILLLSACMSAAAPVTAAEPATGSGIDFQKARQFWAFGPVRQAPPPAVKDADWARTPIDRFILARLESAGLKPSPDADRRALIRRAYFDLIGLPPTPRQIEAFVHDASPDAFEKVVDGLLATEQFGQRWGRHWLDVARFAESSGGGRTIIFKDAWRYRDYVIDAFNADEPYDQFITEQIAGDLLPYESPQQRARQLTATGFLVLGPTNYELQDKELLRMEVIDEQIDTMGKALLGLTLGCARCHDHKFDPVPTTDYYALAGIFRSTKTLTPGNVSGFVLRDLPVPPQQAAALAKHGAAVKALEVRIAQATSRLKALSGNTAVAAAGPAVEVAKLAGVVVDDVDAKLVGQWKHSTFEPDFVGKGYIHDLNTGKGEKSATFTPDLPAAGVYEVRLAYTDGTSRAANTPVTVRCAEGEKTVTVDQRARPKFDRAFVALGRFRFDKGAAGSVTIANKGTSSYVIADAVQFISVDPATGELAAPGSAALPRSAAPGSAATKGHASLDEADVQAQAKRKAEAARVQGDVKKLEDELKALKQNAPPPAPQVMGVIDEADPGDYHVCIRGDAHNLGPKVRRGFITVASTPLSSDSQPPIPADQSGRRQLAQWLTSADNPLTARVMVNRIWLHLFGAGIVRTPDNFGFTGQRPSHPQLLDWLARRYMQDGWSTKKMIRLIMLSHAYQQSSASASDGAPPAATPGRAADPENRLLWRMNRRRLEAEAIRDAMLSVSGRLDLTAGGPSMKGNVGSEFDYKYDSDRRSVYVTVFRNTLYDLFEVFDFADPNLVAGHRNASAVPTQALYMMNSPFVMAQARQAGKRLLAAEGLGDAARVRLAYERTLGRPPTDAERDIVLRFLAEKSAGSDNDAPARRLDAWASVFHTLFASIDFRYLN